MRRLNKNETATSYVPDDDSSDDFDWSQAKQVNFPNLKPSSTTISLRIPVWMLNDIKLLANRQDVPYQSLIKVILAERLEKKPKRRRVSISK